MFLVGQLFRIVLLAVFVCVGSTIANAKEAAVDKVTTLCFGRFLIDLPAGAQIRELGQQSEFMFGQIKSERFEHGKVGFSKKMLERQADLQVGKDEDRFILVDSRALPLVNSHIFKLSKRLYTLTNFGFEAYRLTDDNVLFSMLERDFPEENIDSVLDRLQKRLLPNLRSRSHDEIPTQAGFCMKEGFIADDGSTYQFEEARMQINFKEWPDVWVSIYTQTVPKAGEQTLLQRVDSHPFTGVYATLARQIKTLRKGIHNVNGFKGEEILDLMPTDHGFKQHSFRWETLGAVKSIFAPSIVLEFESGTPLEGEPRRPTLTDDQAIKLYDSIVNSIRLRPTTAPSKSSASDVPKKPLGEQAITGRICPQTGWWQTNDAGVIADWRRRHFNEGERLPKALCHEDLSLWQKIKAERPIQPVAVVWQLVEYGEVPQAIAQEHPVQEVDSAKDVEPPTGG